MLVHGDTATTFAASLAAYYEKIDVGHIEAGLRTGNIYSPWPEEINRKLTGSIARFHFAPTTVSKQNLLNERVPEEAICVTGNTVVDALIYARNKINSDTQLVQKITSTLPKINFDKKIILVTGHRRENFGSGFETICKSLKQLASQRTDIEIVYRAFESKCASPVKISRTLIILF